MKVKKTLVRVLQERVKFIYKSTESILKGLVMFPKKPLKFKNNQVKNNEKLELKI